MNIKVMQMLGALSKTEVYSSANIQRTDENTYS